MLFNRHKTSLVPADQALPGRESPGFALREPHTVLGHPLTGPYPDGLEVADFGLGCFWGAERTFWRLPGVWTTLVGYQGGYTPTRRTRRCAAG